MNKKIFVPFLRIAVVIGCAKKKTETGESADIPLVAPPVDSVTPQAFKSTTAAMSLKLEQNVSAFSLSGSNFSSRFFQSGPTEIRSLLANIDSSIKSINLRSAEAKIDCLKSTPVAATLTVTSDTLSYYFQCSDDMGGGNFSLFGKKDTSWYFYGRNGQSVSAFKVTPNTSDTSKYSVDAYFTVGRINGVPSDGSACTLSWDNCSYGLTHLLADTATNLFEMTTAGVGVGYCGAHMVSDGTQIYIKGSEDGPG